MIKEIVKKFLRTRNSPIGIILASNLLYRKSPFVNIIFSLRITLPLIRFIRKKYGHLPFKFTNTGKIIFFPKNIVIKIPISKFGLIDLENELNNHSKLKKFPLFSYSLKRRGLLFIMSKLDKPNKKIKEKEIYNFLKSIIIQDENTLDYNTVIRHLINKVSKRFSDLKMMINTDKIKYSPNHNDSTCNNIMEFKNKIVLIDISKFEFNSYSEFDQIHFKVQNTCNEDRIWK